MNMKYTKSNLNVISVILTTLVSFSVSAKATFVEPKKDTSQIETRGPAGTSNGGGGYMYYNTSGRYLRSVRDFIVNAIKDVNPADLETLAEKYKVAGRKIDWAEFTQAIGGIKQTNFAKSEKNPDGLLDVQLMTYDKESKTVFALLPFFEIYNKSENQLTEDDMLEILRLPLHEVSHLFGIGTENNNPKNNDSLSNAFSVELRKLLASKTYNCVNGSHENSAKSVLLNCNYQKPEKNNNRTETLSVGFYDAAKGLPVKIDFNSSLAAQIVAWRANILTGKFDTFTIERIKEEISSENIAKFDLSKLPVGSIFTLNFLVISGKGKYIVEFRDSKDQLYSVGRLPMDLGDYYKPNLFEIHGTKLDSELKFWNSK
jgi:hypothetical protein